MGIGQIDHSKIFTKVIVLGCQGQVGKALLALPHARSWLGFSRAQADLSRPESLTELLNEHRPTLVINAAAYTQVDRAETEAELAHAVNAKSPGVLARWCKENGAVFVHYSTDYVFPGQGENFWKESDSTSPLNAYGRTKLEGEQEVQKAGGNFLILRTSWVYDSNGKNFLTTMLRLGRERKQLQIVQDQIGAPTYAPDLAEWTYQALSRAQALPSFPSGVYHLCSSGLTSWHQFACEIFKEARSLQLPLQVEDVGGIASEQYPTPAKRPKNSRMDLGKVEKVFDLRPGSWQAGLKKAFHQLASEKTGSTP